MPWLCLSEWQHTAVLMFCGNSNLISYFHKQSQLQSLHLQHPAWPAYQRLIHSGLSDVALWTVVVTLWNPTQLCRTLNEFHGHQIPSSDQHTREAIPSVTCGQSTPSTSCQNTWRGKANTHAFWMFASREICFLLFFSQSPSSSELFSIRVILKPGPTCILLVCLLG